MRLSELMDKQIVNIYNGVRMGSVGDSDLVIDDESGQLESILLSPRGGRLNIFRTEGNYTTIPWDAVRKIGDEVIIVELNGALPVNRR